MVKPIPTLKKPTSQVPVDAMSAFVSGGQDEPVAAAPLVQVEQHDEPEKADATIHDIGAKKPARRAKSSTGRRLETRGDGSLARKITVYLAPELDKQLSIHSVTNEMDRSDIVAEALARYLRKNGS